MGEIIGAVIGRVSGEQKDRQAQRTARERAELDVERTRLAPFLSAGNINPAFVGADAQPDLGGRAETGMVAGAQFGSQFGKSSDPADSDGGVDLSEGRDALADDPTEVKDVTQVTAPKSGQSTAI